MFGAVDFWRFQPHPEVWVLIVGLTALYVYALRGLGPRVVPVGQVIATTANKRWFALGLILLWISSDWPMHDVAEKYLYSVHMVQHMILGFFVPPVMLMATPEWLARLVIGDGVIGRWFLKLAKPIPAALMFNAVQLATHWAGLVNASVDNGFLHYCLHALVVITALAVWMPVVSPLPEYKINPLPQCIHLFLMSIAPTVPAAWLAMAEGTVYDAYDKPARMFDISVASDQQLAGVVMKLGGGIFLWFLIVVIFFRYTAAQNAKPQARRVVVDDDGTVISIDDLDALPETDVPAEADTESHTGASSGPGDQGGP